MKASLQIKSFKLVKFANFSNKCHLENLQAHGITRRYCKNSEAVSPNATYQPEIFTYWVFPKSTLFDIKLSLEFESFILNDWLPQFYGPVFQFQFYKPMSFEELSGIQIPTRVYFFGPGMNH